MTTSEEEKLSRITRIVRFVHTSDRLSYEAKEVQDSLDELEWESLDYITFLLDIVHGGHSWRQP